MVGVRVAESLAIAVLSASLAAIVVLAVSLWRDIAIGHVSDILLAAGLVAGLLWGYFHRPGILAAALQADRQLQLD